MVHSRWSVSLKHWSALFAGVLVVLASVVVEDPGVDELGDDKWRVVVVFCVAVV